MHSSPEKIAFQTGGMRLEAIIAARLRMASAGQAEGQRAEERRRGRPHPVSQCEIQCEGDDDEDLHQIEHPVSDDAGEQSPRVIERDADDE
jgi:hypothetical protein